MSTTPVGVIIGRMNPPHLGHLKIIRQSISNNPYTIIVLGSCFQQPTSKNPLTHEERRTILEQYLTDLKIPDLMNRVGFVFVPDFHYSNIDWLNAVKDKCFFKAMEMFEDKKSKPSFTIYGYDKDTSSQYLNWFAPWKSFLISEPYKFNDQVLHSTDLRALLFKDGLFALTQPVFTDSYSPTQIEYLNNWIMSGSFHNLEQDYEYYEKYKQAWAAAPFAPTFVTGDALVFCNGHVLTVKRKGPPGADTYALPGGFIEQDEFIKDCIIRELREETKIDIPPGKLKNCLKQIQVFDAPQRSLRGRVITHVGVFVLDEPSLPKVKGADDARSAQWLPLNVVSRMSHQFFEDHYYIIDSLKTI